MTVHRLREWPRLMAGGAIAALILVGIGLAIGALTFGSSSAGARTEIKPSAATISAQRGESALRTQLSAEQAKVSSLQSQLQATRTELSRARRELRKPTRAHSKTAGKHTTSKQTTTHKSTGRTKSKPTRR